MALRDWRSGEMRLLMAAVFLAVTALCAVGFFADRLSSSLVRDAQQLMGGDVVLVSDQPLPDDFMQQAQALGLRTTHMSIFASMARAAGSLDAANEDDALGVVRLVTVKVVDDAYPLLGVLQVQAGLEEPVQQLVHGPAAGEVWISPELLVSLDIQVGDSLMLGDAALRVAQLIVIEPDRGTGGFMASLSPRVLMNVADLSATALVQPASRISYRFALAGDDVAKVKEFEQWAALRIQGKGSEQGGANAGIAMRGVHMEHLKDGQPAMQKTLERAQKFLNLVALLSALLSAVAVAITARDFARRHLDDCAMLRVLGLSQARIAFIYMFEFGIAGVVACVTGVMAGYGLHYVFVAMLAQFLGQDLPAAGGILALFGLGVGMTLLVTFGLPPVLQLSRVPPLRVLRRDTGGLRPAALSVLLVGTFGFMVLLMVVSGDVVLGAITVGGFAAAVLVFAGLAYGVLLLIRPLAVSVRIPVWLRLAVRSLTARPVVLVTQVSALAIGLLALILLVLLRTDLIGSWQQATPSDAPDRFVINIMPDQVDAFQEALRAARVENYDWYPMVRGRLVAINNKPVNLDDYPDERTRRLVDREFNLSYAAQLPAHNVVVQGKWQEEMYAADRGEEFNGASIEADLAQRLGLHVGDSLRFDVAGAMLERPVTSVRKLDWSSMRVNFFVLYPQAQLPGYSETYITAFKAPAGDVRFDDRLAQSFPNVTSINVSATLMQIQQMLGQVSKAVEFLFAFSLVAGLIVLYAAIAATREQRAHDFAVMRALGASNTLLQRVQRAELMGTGAIAGGVAAVVALGIAGALAHFVFDFIWAPPWWVPVAGVLAGLLLAWLAGWLSLRAVLGRPVIEVLRSSQY